MNAHAPVVIDLLEDAIARVRPSLLEGSTKQRIRLLWGAAKMARNLGASDVVRDRFVELAVEVGLIDRSGYWTGKGVHADFRRHGREDVEHVIRWAQRRMNPFETGLLR
jgi:hypothetical protein